MNAEISPESVKEDPNDSRYTIPKTWGVYKISNNVSSRLYRFGNYPIRKNELEREFGSIILVALYKTRESAQTRAKRSNN